MLVAKRREDEASRLRHEAEPEVDDIAKRSSSGGHHEAEQQRRTSRSGAAAEKEVDDVAKQGQRLMSFRSRSKLWREAPCAKRGKGATSMP